MNCHLLVKIITKNCFKIVLDNYYILYLLQKFANNSYPFLYYEFGFHFKVYIIYFRKNHNLLDIFIACSWNVILISLENTKLLKMRAKEKDFNFK
jgi:hypothetical protein